MSVFSHPEYRDHQHVAFHYDRSSGLKAIIAIHNTQLGPALGGCRMWPYASDEEALRDVLRLSRGMTYKSAIANLKLGGGKAVIIGDPRSGKTDALLHAMGDFIESLGGRYITAEDSGTKVADIAKIAERTAHISGLVQGSEHGGDPSPTTAYGVFVGLQAAVEHRFGKSDLSGLKVAVQGVGNVGFRLAQHLRDAGAELYVTDIFAQNVDRAVTELGATAVSEEGLWDLDVDVFAPCALGAVINDTTIERLRAPIVAGAANNQLASEAHGDMLRQKEILYAPDYVINAGGIMDAYYQRHGGSAEQLKAHVETIEQTLLEIFQRSERDQLPTSVVADRMAEERFRLR
ncbi:Glu/Leu/Phe/Val dehydrogenase [Exilibacterium tricleocarpae]|uniref:Glu/Leu/Phe/Val dehydrogenase n=1 Tax=Exilibacterium tricleocarpae TaxID=2591008 RepID=A0A545U5H9_9GAMM|nr:Glu/Leu/Phe/Val dehydrogenase dimerization domain-containing protein [Exilibacterium tricleocarpae]TQV84717.1 Glu/Leu/Phe/Val dehydrogenase [Exilibacterium tricleocarpae]